MAKRNKLSGNSEAKESSANAVLKSSLDFTKTRTDRLALFIIDILGSMTFLMLCMLLFVVWICLNLGLIYPLKPFDPFPFPKLEMGVSLFAIILSVAVLINQNRQGKIEKVRQQVEFEVNVRAEAEITKVLNMLYDIHKKLGIDIGKDKQLEEMKAVTDVKQIHKTIDSQETTDGNNNI